MPFLLQRSSKDPMSCLIFRFYSGLIAGQGGLRQDSYGMGGWSWYNPKYVLQVVDTRNQIMTPFSRPNPSLNTTTTTTTTPESASMPTWKHTGQGKTMMRCYLTRNSHLCYYSGYVNIMPPLYGTDCQKNCSALGAKCLALDPRKHHVKCICPNGVVLSHNHPSCSISKSKQTYCHHTLDLTSA